MFARSRLCSAGAKRGGGVVEDRDREPQLVRCTDLPLEVDGPPHSRPEQISVQGPRPDPRIGWRRPLRGFAPRLLDPAKLEIKREPGRPALMTANVGVG